MDMACPHCRSPLETLPAGSPDDPVCPVCGAPVQPTDSVTPSWSAPREKRCLGKFELLESLGLVSSRGEARRLIAQKAVQVDGQNVADAALQLRKGEYLLRVGKRRFARVRIG